MNCPICTKKMPPKTLFFCPVCWWTLPPPDRTALNTLHRHGNKAAVASKIAAIVRRVKRADGANVKILVADDVRGPFGCRCQTMSQRVLGDGCDICNPELAKEFADENSEEEKP